MRSARIAALRITGYWRTPPAHSDISRDCQGRSWRCCPRCGIRRGHLYLPEALYRVCLRLDYACRHGAGRKLPLVIQIAR